MLEFLKDLFSNQFMPHGHCYYWQPGLLWLQIASDGLIALAYFSIPAALLVFVKKRNDLSQKKVFYLFIAFILSCGATHLFGIITIWNPVYWIEGFVKLLTAGVSIITAIVLWPIIPHALAIPSHKELKEKNQMLEQEIREKEKAESSLQNYQQHLEEIVEHRTRELEKTNEQLTSEIAERKSTEQKLIKAKEDAEEAGKAKEQFLNTMSHEIRTPLNAVIGMANILLRENHLPHQTENFKTLQFSANNLLSLINDVLDISKIEAGKIVFDSVPFNLKESVHGIIQTLQFKAEEKNINLEASISSEVPVFVKGDEKRLNQILSNLINNALKFTEEGHVKVNITVDHFNTNGQALLFKIEDTGEGIPYNKQDEIFERFHQAGGNHHGGTGLGLAICKMLVELQGGEIGFESTPQKGTTFYFTLAFEQVNYDIPETSLHDQSSEKNNLQGLNILVIEDNKANQMVLKKLFDYWQASVTIEENGESGLEKVKTKAYDLVITDLKMPVMDGYAFTQYVREIEEPYFKHLPIIATTASVYMEKKDLLQKKGFQDFISKPFAPEVLLNKILKLVPEKISENNIQEDLKSEKGEEGIVDFEKLKEFYKADKTFLKEYIDRVIDLFHELYYSLNNIEKFNIDEIEPVRKSVHKIKSSFYNFDFGTLHQELESFKAALYQNDNIIYKKGLLNNLITHVSDIITQLRNEKEKF